MVIDPEVLPTRFERYVAGQLGKATKLPRASSSTRAEQVLSLVQTDLSGKQSVQAPGGFSYFMTFIDDFSSFTVVVLLEKKSDAAEATMKYCAAMENQTGKTIKRIRSDNGGEDVNSSLQGFFTKEGIKHKTTVPYWHESNGVAKQFNRTLQERARTDGVKSGLPPSLWEKAITMLTHVKNRLPHSVLEKPTPFNGYCGKKPSIKHLQYFGETAYVFIPAVARKPGTKLSPRAEEGKICGFSESDKEYRVYLPSRKLVVSVTALYLEL